MDVRKMDILDLQREILGEMEQSNIYLDEIRETLGSINQRMTKYLDHVEGKAEVIDPPMVPYVFVKPETISQFNPYCSWCMAEIGYHDKSHTCEHVTLCMACAPCDECNIKEKA